jgi:hypothetical protein
LSAKSASTSKDRYDWSWVQGKLPLPADPMQNFENFSLENTGVGLVTTTVLRSLVGTVASFFRHPGRIVNVNFCAPLGWKIYGN